jgi:CRISPR/Cas system-associated protein endoribonuclease Cas2
MYNDLPTQEEMLFRAKNLVTQGYGMHLTTRLLYIADSLNTLVFIYQTTRRHIPEHHNLCLSLNVTEFQSDRDGYLHFTQLVFLRSNVIGHMTL